MAIEMVCRIKKGYAERHPITDPATGEVLRWRVGKVYVGQKFFHRGLPEDAPSWAEAVEESDREMIEKAREAKALREAQEGVAKRRAKARAAVGLPPDSPEDYEAPAPALAAATPAAEKPPDSISSGDLEALRERARGLGVTNAGNMNVNTLKKRIKEKEASSPTAAEA